jgi:hypothetical protein
MHIKRIKSRTWNTNQWGELILTDGRKVEGAE